MFRHEGPARSEAKNAALAAFLALTGGYVNSAGFVLLGVFTSHVTGNVGRIAIDVTRQDAEGSWEGLAMVGAFFAGAVIASVIIESAAFRFKPWAYGAALALEAALLLAFYLLPEAPPQALRSPVSRAALMCASMGLQNSLVTRLSGAVVRTTHLTGVLTDLGIEVARWLRWGRACLARRLGMPLVLGEAERPGAAKLRLLSIITISFGTGSLSGAWACLHFRYRALSLPVIGLALAAAYAVSTGRKQAASPSIRAAAQQPGAPEPTGRQT